MELENELRKLLNLGANDNLVEAVTQLKSDADFKAKYEDLKKANQDKEEAEASNLINKLKEAKLVDEDMIPTYEAMFKSDFANTKKVVEGIMKKGAVKGDPDNKLDAFLGGLNGQGEGGKKPEAKTYDWYQKNDQAALTKMMSDEPEKFQKLFDEHFK